MKPSDVLFGTDIQYIYKAVPNRYVAMFGLIMQYHLAFR